MFKVMNFTKKTLAVTSVALGLLAAGCATAPDPSDEAAVQAFNEANDPLEPMNRYFFEVNHGLDELLVKPFAGYYNIALPDPAKDSIRNFLRNLRSPVILANDLFQNIFECDEAHDLTILVDDECQATSITLEIL